MKQYLRAITLLLLSFAFSSCVSTIGSPSHRTIGHIYQDARGLHTISLFEFGTVARGIGKDGTKQPLSLSIVEFDRLWAALEKIDLARYKVASDTEDFDVRDSYVVSKGFMPRGPSETYVVPHSQAPPSLRKWISELRTKTKS